jgi:F-type H+-transporting ATPase subunit b
MRRVQLRLLVGLVLLAAPIFAEESGAAPEQSGTMIWQVLNFFILAAALGWLTKKYVAPLLASRSIEIREGLEAGKKAKADADARAAEVQRKIANLGSEIAALRTGAKEERDREAERLRRETQAEIARIHLQAEHEIESAGKQARLEVRRVGARIAIELAENQVRARMSPEVQAALLQGFIADLSGSDLVKPSAFRTATNVD